MKLTAILALAPIFTTAQPSKLVARQDNGAIAVPEGPLPLCTSHCFGRWGWPITLCTGQEGLNHLIECFYEECEDEPRRIHAQLAAEQNCEDGMGWPNKMPEDLQVESMPAGEEEEASAPASSTATSSASGTSSQGSVPTGAFDVENPSSTVSDVAASATETPNGARQATFVEYAGAAVAIMGVYAVL